MAQASPGIVTTYGYDASGNRTSEQLPNGAYTKYTYDVMNRLKQLDSWLPGVLAGNRTDTNAVMLQVYTLAANGKAAHVHLKEKAARLASIRIDDGELLVGRIPHEVRRCLLDWIATNRIALLKDWDDMQVHKRPTHYGDFGPC